VGFIACPLRETGEGFLYKLEKSIWIFCMDTADYANLADQCEALLKRIDPNIIYSFQNGSKFSLAYIAIPETVCFISVIEIGARGGIIGRFITYDPRKPTWERVTIYKERSGFKVGPLAIPSIKSGDREKSISASRSALKELKSRFDSGELTESKTIAICDICLSRIQGDSIIGLVGGKCSPS
jgi:hypothetical protein